MKYLLDVNVLLAWGWADHSEHRRAAMWVAATKRKRGARLLTSAIPELGFVRVSVQRSAGRLSVEDAAGTLAGMLHSLGGHHSFLPDDRSSSAGFPAWCGSASQTTDAHLLALAQTNGMKLATLDTGIPGASDSRCQSLRKFRHLRFLTRGPTTRAPISDRLSPNRNPAETGSGKLSIRLL